jgi:hypothetical protein
MSLSTFLHRIWHNHEILCDKKCRGFFFSDVINIPSKLAAASAPYEVSHYAVCSSARPLPPPSIFRNIFSNTLSLFFIPLNWRTKCHTVPHRHGYVVLRQQKERRKPSGPNRSRAIPEFNLLILFDCMQYWFFCILPKSLEVLTF